MQRNVESIGPSPSAFERRKTYLSIAADAQRIAEGANSPTMQKRYLRLARFWTSLANEVQVEHSRGNSR
jgi:hypothetical protein